MRYGKRQGESPRIGARLHPAVHERFEEVCEELGIAKSALIQHGVLLVLAGLGRLPEHLSRYYDKLALPERKLNEDVPVVAGWTDHIPEDAERVEARRW